MELDYDQCKNIRRTIKYLNLMQVMRALAPL